jgi:ribosomal protein S18 acetylase RimI-like enzyme
MEPAPADRVSVAQPISAAATRPLRQAVLRPHQSADELVWPGDDAPEALHLGISDQAGLVGVASIAPEPLPGDARAGAWRVRGMAVRPECRRSGCGRALLEAALAHARSRGGSTVWCNARTPAVPFYRAHGFETRGEEFELPQIGPHYLMWRPL